MERATLDEAKESLKKIGEEIRGQMPEGWGFVLLYGTYGQGGIMTYLSSVEREDAIKMMLEFVEKQIANTPHLEDVN